MAKIRIYSHSMASKGQREVKKELNERGHNCLTLKKTGSSYQHQGSHLVINWGFRRAPFFTAPDTHFLNGNMEGIHAAADKLLTFKVWEDAGVRAPLYAEDRQGAEELFGHGAKVYCRTLRTGSKGRGIVVSNTIEELVGCELYTQGLDIKHEYRVHVFKGAMIDAVMKRRMNSDRIAEEGINLNMDVRNHDNGWVFARQDLTISPELEALAIQATESLGLDFAAIDLITDHYDTPYAIEANTAPGLVGQTIQSYANAIEGYAEGL